MQLSIPHQLLTTVSRVIQMFVKHHCRKKLIQSLHKKRNITFKQKYYTKIEVWSSCVNVGVNTHMAAMEVLNTNTR